MHLTFQRFVLLFQFLFGQFQKLVCFCEICQSFLSFLAQYFIFLQLKFVLLFPASEQFQLRLYLLWHKAQQRSFCLQIIQRSQFLFGNIKLLQQRNNLQLNLEERFLIFYLKQVLKPLNFVLDQPVEWLYFLGKLICADMVTQLL